jgi:hypothetical protein
MVKLGHDIHRTSPDIHRTRNIEQHWSFPRWSKVLVFCVSVQKGLKYKRLRVAVDASIRYRRRFLAEVQGGMS